MSAHASHAMHDNSLAAYRSEEPKLSRRAREILSYLEKAHKGTDRDIAYGMGFGENLNAVRPRITEAIKAGILAELTNTECPVTKKTVRVVGFPPRQQALFS